MGMPYKQVDKALQDYAAFLRDKVADAEAPPSAAAVAPIQPAASPKYASVPDLAEIVALPQDELRDIVARFNAQGGRARPRRAGRPGRRAGRAIGAARQPRLAGGAVVTRLRCPVSQRAG